MTALRIALVVLALVFFAPIVHAQPPPPTQTEHAADWISTGLVGANMVADGIYSYKHHCMKGFLLKNGAVILVSELGKHFVHKERPNHVDFKSWPSEHSALGMANRGWNLKIGFSIGVGAGAGRVISLFHDPLDVLSGLAIGWTADYAFPCGE